MKENKLTFTWVVVTANEVTWCWMLLLWD